MGKKKIEVIKEVDHYEWKDTNCRFAKKADANDIGTEINAIIKNSGDDKASNEEILEYATVHKSSALNKLFQWDDSKAAHAYRLKQAGDIKNSIKTVWTTKTVVKAQQETFEFDSTATYHALKTLPGKGHENIEKILNSPVKVGALELEMHESIRAYVKNFGNRYNVVPGFDKIFAELQKVLLVLP